MTSQDLQIGTYLKNKQTGKIVTIICTKCTNSPRLWKLSLEECRNLDYISQNYILLPKKDADFYEAERRIQRKDSVLKTLEKIKSRIILLKFDFVKTPEQFLGDKEKNIENIVYMFFYLNDKYDTIYSNGRIQTYAWRRRSLQDIYYVIKYYFPEITLEQIMQVIYDGVKAGYLSTWFCIDIEKRVFWKDSYTQQYLERADEWGFIFEDYNFKE